MNVIARDRGTLVDDTYNANPGSVRAAIAWLAGRPAPRALVLGAMGELGPDAETLIGELGEDAKQAGIETLITLPGAHAAAEAFGTAPGRWTIMTRPPATPREFSPPVAPYWSRGRALPAWSRWCNGSPTRGRSTDAAVAGGTTG
ncbi:UDP-N-acetylmuramoyl-tripeptide--D-alanyl-D-alanine ligase [Alcanivorax sp. ALC70]|nr:UDP-N-acetylmuramoyl-tripeptide--D-alanyl-D-alanine ligase [Alcanivorax sp. ALC70]